MVVIEGEPYAISTIYLRLEGVKEAVSIPFSEAMAIFTNVSFDYKASKAASTTNGSIHYVIKGDTEQAKNEIYIVAKPEVIKRLQSALYSGRPEVIVDMAIQPEDERLVDEVKQLIAT